MPYALLYVAIASIIGFAMVCSDKRKARAGAWRIPEKTFLLLSLLGGGAGVLAGFFLFRHKTRHKALLAGVTAATVLSYGAIAAIFAGFP